MNVLITAKSQNKRFSYSQIPNLDYSLFSQKLFVLQLTLIITFLLVYRRCDKLYSQNNSLDYCIDYRLLSENKLCFD